MSDDIARHLGIAPMTIEAEIVTVKNKDTDDTPEADRDYKYARDNFYSIIETGTRALEDLLDVASQSQHPKA